MAELTVKFSILVIIATCALAQNYQYSGFGTCDYYENIELGRVYDVFSPFYPGKYPPGTNCRWSGCAPYGTNIVIKCTDMAIPTYGQCDQNGDRLEISYQGCQDLADASRHCTRPFVMETRSNALVMALRTFPNSTGGRFFCQVRAQPVALPAPRPVSPSQWVIGPSFPTQNVYVPPQSAPVIVYRPPSYAPSYPSQTYYPQAQPTAPPPVISQAPQFVPAQQPQFQPVQPPQFQPAPQPQFQPAPQPQFQPAPQPQFQPAPQPQFQPAPQPQFQPQPAQPPFRPPPQPQPMPPPQPQPQPQPVFQPVYQPAFPAPQQQPQPIYQPVYQPGVSTQQSTIINGYPGGQTIYPGQVIYAPQQQQGQYPPYTPTQPVYQPMGPQNQPICMCGVRKKTPSIQPRILNGANTDIEQMPFACALTDLNTKRIFCDCTIISANFILTTAHCLFNRTIDTVGIIVGTTDYARPQQSRYAATYRIAGVVIHPDYDPLSMLNDISIAKTGPIEFNPAVGPVCLPISDRLSKPSYAYSPVEVGGWGDTSYTGPSSSHFQSVTLNIITNDQCNDNYPYRITASQMCLLTAGKDTCNGDDGAGLCHVDTVTGRLVIIGMPSYGVGCGTRQPRVAVRVSSYIPWILRTTNENYCTI